MRSCLALLVLLHTAQAAADVAATDCRARDSAVEVRVDHVIDGDTVILQGGDRLRLIGIDTPELGHGGAASQPGAIEARNALAGLLGSPASVHRVIRDQEPRDAHGRTLAHLFLGDGTNVQARLLQDGLAVRLTIPPNLAFINCYERESRQAQSAGGGLWSLPAYQPIAAEKLNQGTRGYRVVHGRVSRIGRSRSSVWLNLGPRFAVRIVAGDVVNFREAGLDALEGQAVEARGLVYSRNAQLRMRIRHPVDLRKLEPENPPN